MFIRILFLLALSPSLYAQWFEADRAIMGSNIHIQFWCDENGERLLEQSLAILQRVDEQMSPHKPQSELSLINKNAFKNPVILSSELFQLIEKSQTISQLSQGAFDISFASIGYDYHYKKQQKPSDHVIDQKLKAINYKNIILNKQHRSIRFTQEALKIDLGGIAKGYAVDQVYDFLVHQGVKHALITAGGDSRLLGDKKGKPWIVGIKNPRPTPSSSAHSLLIPLENTALSTSGDYERFFIEDGMRYHHILNPTTGKSPRSNIQSVSILADDSTTADALSTTVFVLGIKKGLALINRLEKTDAIIISAGGLFHYSDGLQQLQ